MRSDFRDRPIRSHTSRRTNPVLITLVAVVLFLLASVGVVSVVVIHRSSGGHTPFGPSAGNEGVRWNYKELVAHLDGRGLKLEWEAAETGILIAPAGKRRQIVEMKEASKLNHPLSGAFDYSPSGPVFVEQHLDAQSAHDSSDLVDAPTRAFDWGRFTFEGENISLLELIKSALR